MFVQISFICLIILKDENSGRKMLYLVFFFLLFFFAWIIQVLDFSKRLSMKKKPANALLEHVFKVITKDSKLIFSLSSFFFIIIWGVIAIRAGRYDFGPKEAYFIRILWSSTQACLVFFCWNWSFEKEKEEKIFLLLLESTVDSCSLVVWSGGVPKFLWGLLSMIHFQPAAIAQIHPRTSCLFQMLFSFRKMMGLIKFKCEIQHILHFCLFPFVSIFFLITYCAFHLFFFFFANQ